MRTARGADAARALVPVAFLAVFFLAPLAGAVAEFASLEGLRRVLTEEFFRDRAVFTLAQAAASTVLALAAGLPLAWAVSRWTFPGSRLVAGAVTAPFLMPGVVIATGVLAVMPGRGLPAILWAHVVFNTAVVVRTVGPRWAMVDRAMEESAQSLGATPWRVFSQVTWPVLRPAVLGAAGIVCSFCLMSFSVIVILGGAARGTVETEIYVRALYLGDLETAVALATLEAVVVLGLLLLSRRGGAPGSLLSERSGARPASERMRMRWLPGAVSLVLTSVVTVPLAAVAWRSLRGADGWSTAGWRALFDGTLERVGIDPVASVLRSAEFAAATVAISVPLAVLACRRTRTGAAERLLLAPLAVSPVALGLGIIVTFDRGPLDWRGATWLVPVVHSVIAMPLAAGVIGPALRAIGDDLLDSAADLGATRRRAWTSVVLPSLRPAIVRAAGLCAAVSLGEFGATSFLTRHDTATLPVAIGLLMGRPGGVLHQAGFALATLAAAVFPLSVLVAAPAGGENTIAIRRHGTTSERDDAHDEGGGEQ